MLFTIWYSAKRLKAFYCRMKLFWSLLWLELDWISVETLEMGLLLLLLVLEISLQA